METQTKETVTSNSGVEWTLVVGCGTCERARDNGELPFISHFNCLYINRASIGHDSGRNGHCTADACY